MRARDKLSDLFDQLLHIQFIWTITATQQLFFGLPRPATRYADERSGSLGLRRMEAKRCAFRNWQGVKLSYDAFSHSEEYFVGQDKGSSH